MSSHFLTTNKYNTKTVGRVATLTVDDCRLTDAGEYNCSQVSTASEEVQFVGSVQLNVSRKTIILIIEY